MHRCVVQKSDGVLDGGVLLGALRCRLFRGVAGGRGSDGRIVRAKLADELGLASPHLGVRGRLGLPKNLLANREVAALLARDVGRASQMSKMRL
jgi:hypothetical protein